MPSSATMLRASVLVLAALVLLSFAAGDGSGSSNSRDSSGNSRSGDSSGNSRSGDSSGSSRSGDSSSRSSGNRGSSDGTQYDNSHRSGSGSNSHNSNSGSNSGGSRSSDRSGSGSSGDGSRRYHSQMSYRHSGNDNSNSGNSNRHGSGSSNSGGSSSNHGSGSSNSGGSSSNRGSGGSSGRKLLQSPEATGFVELFVGPNGIDFNVTLTGVTSESAGNVTYSHMHSNTETNSHIAYFSDDGDQGVSVSMDEADDVLLSSGFIPFEIVAANANATDLEELLAMFDTGMFVGDLHTTDYQPPVEFLRGTFLPA